MAHPSRFCLGGAFVSSRVVCEVNVTRRWIVPPLKGLETFYGPLPSIALAFGVASCWAIFLPSRFAGLRACVLRSLMPTETWISVGNCAATLAANAQGVKLSVPSSFLPSCADRSRT